RRLFGAKLRRPPGRFLKRQDRGGPRFVFGRSLKSVLRPEGNRKGAPKHLGGPASRAGSALRLGLQKLSRQPLSEPPLRASHARQKRVGEVPSKGGFAQGPPLPLEPFQPGGLPGGGLRSGRGRR